MTLEQTYDVFGAEQGQDKTPEEALLALAVYTPGFAQRDIMKLVSDLMDVHEVPLSRVRDSFIKGNISVGELARSCGMARDSSIRTVFRIMFETDAWDAEILQPAFIEFVSGLKTEYASKVMTRKQQWWKRVLDSYEILTEMEEKLRAKTLAKRYSGLVQKTGRTG